MFKLKYFLIQFTWIFFISLVITILIGLDGRILLTIHQWKYLVTIWLIWMALLFILLTIIFILFIFSQLFNIYKSYKKKKIKNWWFILHGILKSYTLWTGLVFAFAPTFYVMSNFDFATFHTFIQNNWLCTHLVFFYNLYQLWHHESFIGFAILGNWYHYIVTHRSIYIFVYFIIWACVFKIFLSQILHGIWSAIYNFSSIKYKPIHDFNFFPFTGKITKYIFKFFHLGFLPIIAFLYSTIFLTEKEAFKEWHNYKNKKFDEGPSEIPYNLTNLFFILTLMIFVFYHSIYSYLGVLYEAAQNILYLKSQNEYFIPTFLVNVSQNIIFGPIPKYLYLFEEITKIGGPEKILILKITNFLSFEDVWNKHAIATAKTYSWSIIQFIKSFF